MQIYTAVKLRFVMQQALAIVIWSFCNDTQITEKQQATFPEEIPHRSIDSQRFS